MTNKQLVLQEWSICPLCHKDLTGAINILGAPTTVSGHLQAHEAEALNTLLTAVDGLLQGNGDIYLDKLREAREAHKRVQYQQGRWEGWVNNSH